VKRTLLLLAVLVAGCGGDQVRSEPAASLDCAYPLVWNEVRYEVGVELPRDWELGSALGPGVVLGCGSDELGYYPDEDVDVRSVEGIDPAIAVAALLEDATRSLVWVAPGYLIASPRHPLHEALAPNWGYADTADEFTCKKTFRSRARSLTTPGLGQPLEVKAVNPAVEALLVAPGGNRAVSLDPRTEITGFDRNGVPYVSDGDEFVLVLSTCWDESDPTAGSPLLLAKSIRKI
jgi:hypothetical protein